MSGEQAAVEAVAAALAELDDDGEAEQLGLFGEPQTEAGKALFPAEKRGPGRPWGSRNKRTERTVQWLLQRYRDPRAVLLEIAEANVGDLAARLGCSLYEALQEKRLCAQAVLPYVAQRQPLAVDVTNRQVVYLTIHEGQAEQSGPGDDAIAVRVVESVEYREVGDDENPAD